MHPPYRELDRLASADCGRPLTDMIGAEACVRQTTRNDRNERRRRCTARRADVATTPTDTAAATHIAAATPT